MEDLSQRLGAYAAGAPSVSRIRHLGTASGKMFIVQCSHNPPATAELPFAIRPGDRTDGFRPTCHTSSGGQFLYRWLKEICA